MPRPENQSRMVLLVSRQDPLARRSPRVPPVSSCRFWMMIRRISPAAIVTMAKKSPRSLSVGSPMSTPNRAARATAHGIAISMGTPLVIISPVA